VSAAIALLVCASAFADSGKNVVIPSKQDARQARRLCYVIITGSNIPQPCERLGQSPSTAIPMVIIGDYPVERGKK
jgi:hypothetical protein